MSVYTVQLSTDGMNTPVAYQSLAGGPALSITLHNSNRGAGTVPGYAFLDHNTSSGTFLFTPVGAGTTVVSLDQPTGFTTPRMYSSVTMIVQ